MNQFKVADIRNLFCDKLQRGDFVTDKTGVKTVEIIGTSFIADESTIFGVVNLDYVNRELSWYKSMSLNVNDIPGNTPQIWTAVADHDGFINSNYGWAIWHKDNYYQYNHCIAELKSNRDSRRATMIYTRPKMWLDFNKNGRSDFMCTNAVQYLIRDNMVHAIVQMRSSDAIFGYKNDLAWHKYILESVARDVNCSVGDIIWHAGSLHIYSRHFDLIKDSKKV